MPHPALNPMLKSSLIRLVLWVKGVVTTDNASTLASSVTANGTVPMARMNLNITAVTQLLEKSCKFSILCLLILLLKMFAILFRGRVGQWTEEKQAFLTSKNTGVVTVRTTAVTVLTNSTVKIVCSDVF
ncbi:unnamed protein product [Mesocestoides corti]|uniref:Uncharacterized protein n=1 Tax=Mesocestoides corti TaxID=53468 RepID=A0A3P6H0V6_MESCO|nr:unnamed protein product [Mesocestoides corti]